jgi:hypothetical protein
MTDFEYWMAKVNEEAEALVKNLDEANKVLRKLSESTGNLLTITTATFGCGGVYDDLMSKYKNGGLENEIHIQNSVDTSEQ